jgi:ABC-type multidrug transport system permease subunit
LKAAKNFVYPPLVEYVKEGADDQTNGMANNQGTNAASLQSAIGNRKSGMGSSPAKPKNNQSFDLFAYLLLGLSGMFLLFLGQNAMTDLHRELRKRTFERYQTLHQRVWPFIFGKIVFAVVMLLLCSAVMLGGGGLVFRIQWQHPLTLCALVTAYCCFIAALFAVLVALVPDERRAGVLNNVAGMALGTVGGCAFPPQNLPAFLRDHITPLMPSYWFATTARNVQAASSDAHWQLAVLKLMLCSIILVALATWLLRRKFITGLRT